MKNQPPCRWCGAVAVFRFALLASDKEHPSTLLRDQPRFSCVHHFADQIASLPDGYALAVAVDPLFTRLALPGGPLDATQPMTPIRETIRRRPPALDVRELRGPELLRALAAELEHLDDDL